METKKERKRKGKPTSRETEEFWSDWRKRNIPTSSGRSLEEIRNGLEKKDRTGWKIFSYFFSIILGVLVFVMDPVLLDVLRKMFKTKPKKKKD